MTLFKFTHDEPCGMCGSPHTGNSDISPKNAEDLAVAKVKACYAEHVKRQNAARLKLREAC